MNKIVLGLVLIFLCGCSPNVSKQAIDVSIELCTKNEGLKLIRVSDLNITVRCNNGSKFTLVENKDKVFILK